MAIDFSSTCFFRHEPIQSTNPTIPDNKYKPNKVMSEWLFHGYTTGDASGGAVSCDIDFGSNFDNNHYIVITNISFAFGVNESLTLWTDSDRWDNLYMPNCTNRQYPIWVPSDTYRPRYDDLLKKPIYMGRVRVKDSNPGLCTASIATNTNSAEYNIYIQGFTLERPLPFSSILQP